MPTDPRNGEQMADRHAVASGENEREHDENGMVEINIGKRGLETAHEEQPDNLRNTVQPEHATSSSTSTSSKRVSLEYLASGEKKDQTELVLEQRSGHLENDIQMSALEVFYEMD